MTGFEEFLAGLRSVLMTPRGVQVLQGLILFAVGLVLARLVGTAVRRIIRDRFDPQVRILLRRGIVYGIVLLFGLSGLHTAGFDLRVLLGAAGILTVALGFASQTSVSNIISGLFLLGEKPFSVGDTIRLDDLTGEVLSIDLLSVKVRTFDNLFVRVPNEVLLKSRITNLTRFPIRRLDLPIGVAYQADIRRAIAVLLEVADANPHCLDEPKPMVVHQGFGDSAINLRFSTWFVREYVLEYRTQLQIEIQEAFDREGIEIPFPQRVVHLAGAETVEPATEGLPPSP